MKNFRVFDISDFTNGGYKRKAGNDFWDSCLSQHPDKYMTLAEAHRLLELMGAEYKVTSDAEKENEIERLMKTIRAAREIHQVPSNQR